jgi:hypothetical protein
VSDLNLDEIKSQIEIPELDLNLGIDYSDKNKEIDTNEFSDEMVLKLSFNEENYIAVKEALSRINDSPEIAIMQLLKI